MSVDRGKPDLAVGRIEGSGGLARSWSSAVGKPLVSAEAGSGCTSTRISVMPEKVIELHRFASL